MRSSFSVSSVFAPRTTVDAPIRAGSDLAGTRKAGQFFLTLIILLAISGFLSCSANCENIPITLPIEVMGVDGTTASVMAKLTPFDSSRVRSLWMRIQGLEYSDMVSVRVNHGEWRALNNQTVQVGAPGKSYGGIGGGFTTLPVTLLLSSGTVFAGDNLIEFRFNRSNGVKSGFRVLEFNFLDEHGSRLMEATAFLEEDPTRWTAPFTDQASLEDGNRQWQSASLRSNNRPGAKMIHAHCADCHARDGRDLKYFSFSNRSIIARAVYHGLSVEDGMRIASYIRKLPIPSPGRPWDPPYQPGPGLDAKPLSDWAAGAGLSYALASDLDTLPYLFSQKDSTSHSRGEAVAGGNSVGPTFMHSILVSPKPADFAADGTLNAREIPISIQLPDWNHWLPRVHPKDAWGELFESSKLAGMYRESESGRTVGKSEQDQALSADSGSFFERWVRARDALLSNAMRNRRIHRNSQGISPHAGFEIAEAVYSTQLWQLIKTWEMTVGQDLDTAEVPDRPANKARRWTNVMLAATAPSETPFATIIEDRMKASENSDLPLMRLRQEYLNNSWYELQILLNNGDHHHRGRLPVNWIYVAGHVLELERLSYRPEPARSLITFIEGMQSSDQKAAPTNQLEGWRPEQMLDPRILVDPDWRQTFEQLPPQLRARIAESLLKAWLDKVEEYPAAAYFVRGQPSATYILANDKNGKDLRDFSGGKAWLAADQFLAAGVDAATVDRLVHWGNDYSTLAQLFHY